MNNKMISCLRLLQFKSNIFQIAKELECSWLNVLEYIGILNSIEEDLISRSSYLGYYVTRKLDWIDENKLNRKLNSLKLNFYIIKILTTTASTNTYVLNNLESLNNNSVVIAEHQSDGRGRNNKNWYSRIAADITISFLYFIKLEINYELLPMVVAVGINRLLKFYKIKNFIKWPNDIYTKLNEKVAGILIESGKKDGKRYIVIGIGLDNNENINRSELLANLIFYIDQVINEYLNQGFVKLRREWLDNCIHYKKMVYIYKENELIEQGVNIDLKLNGDLVVKSKDKLNYYINSSYSLKYK